MSRKLFAALAVSALTVSGAFAQGPLQRVGQAFDRAGKNIRADVEGAVARGQISAAERDLLFRVSERINWDKQLVNSTMALTVVADGTVYLRGSVTNPVAKARAVDLAENTIGVTRVVDELAVVKAVKVIETRPGVVIETRPAVVIETRPAAVIDGKPPVVIESTPVVPEEKVIEKP